MSEENQVPSELDLLKKRADMMGITYHPNIGLEKLKAKLAGVDDEPEEVAQPVAKPVPVKQSAEAIRRDKIKAANKLVRIEITCMNPNKKGWQGEIFTVSNSVIGTIKKFVAFGVPYHVPQAIFNMIQERKCQVFETKKDSRGNSVRRGKLIKEFSINKLDPLTESELKALAAKQAAAGGLDN